METIFFDIDFNQNKVFKKTLPTENAARFQKHMKEYNDAFISPYTESSTEFKILESSPSYVEFTHEGYGSNVEIKHFINRASLEYTITSYTYNADGSLEQLEILIGGTNVYQNPLIDTRQCYEPNV